MNARISKPIEILQVEDNPGEVLGALKEDPELRRVPVVVLTTSQAEQDIVHGFWLGVVKLPNS